MTSSLHPAGRSLRSIPLLASIGEGELRAIEGKCRWRSYDPDSVILDKGANSREVFFLTKGQLAVVTFSPSGKDVTLAILHPGEFFGELAAIDEQPRSASVTALTGSELCVMPHDVFLELVRGKAEVGYQLLLRLAKLIRLGDLRILEISTLPAAQRVYCELLRMARPDAATPNLWVIAPMPPMQDIASLTSTSRETVNRAISQLYPSGLLRRKGRNLYIGDRQKLEDLVRTIDAHYSRRA